MKHSVNKKAVLSPEPSRLGAGRACGARRVAWDVLLEIERRDAFADALLDRALRASGLAARDRGLAHELVYGVLRRRLTLDWRLEQVADRPVERLPAPVRTALRLGAYQLLYLDRVPAPAAVDESVELVKAGPRPGTRDWSGYVNAVLRAVMRAPCPAMPDPASDPVLALSLRYACPPWLVERWVTRGGTDFAEALCRRTVSVPPLTIRANTLHTTRDALAGELARAGWTVTNTPVSPVGLIVEKRGTLTELPGFQEGAFYVEDEAGQLIPPLLDPQPGERILDACAAPGGKASHLAALMGNRGAVVAVDRSPVRLRRLEENCRRLGVSIVRTVAADLSREPPAGLRAHPFDRILLDAPCTALGVLRRHPEGKWRKTESMIGEHQALQRKLLAQSAALLRAGGVIVYSTCSTEPEETEQVIAPFCDDHRDFRREGVGPWLPPTGHALLTAEGALSTMSVPSTAENMDGFYAVRLRKAER